jgi:type I restriction enzyme S subunit
MTGQAFGILFSDLRDYWEVRSVRIFLTNRCAWDTVKLGEVCQLRFEIIPEQEFQEGDTQLLDRISFDEGKIFSGKRTATKMTQYRAKPNDIVVSKINARKRAIGIVPEGHDIGITIHFRALIPDTSKIDTKFLWLALRNPFCTNQFDVETGGIGKGEISEERLLNIRVPFPPIDEQKRIVAAWQQAQVKAAKAQERVEQVEREIETRFYLDLGLKPPKKASRLKTFVVRWKDFERWSVSYSQAVHSGTDITHGKYPIRELGSLLEFVQYGTSEKANTKEDGTPVLRINNIKNGILDLSDLKHIPLAKKTLDGLLLKDGDILVIRTNGSRDLVGTCAVFHEKEDYVFASYLIRLRFNSQKVNPDFVSHFLNSELGREQVNAISRQIMQNNINSEELRSLQIPLPPLDVQKEIMRRVEEGRSKIRQEQEFAAKLKEESEREIERMILGLSKA